MEIQDHGQRSVRSVCRAQRCNFVKGSGANSKSMLSDLRAYRNNDYQQLVSPSVFDSGEEFRRQACGFAFARAIAFQKAARSVKIQTHVFEKLVSREVLPGKCSYGRETLCLSWQSAANLLGGQFRHSARGSPEQMMRPKGGRV